MVPVHDRVIEAQLDPRSVARVGQLLERVALERRGFDAPVGLVRAEHAEAIMVLGRDDDVFHPGRFGEADPLLVELHGVELAGELLVLGNRHLGFLEKPLAVVGLAVPLARRHGINTPMNEQPEPGVMEPGHALVALGGGFSGLGNDGCQQQGQRGQDEQCFHDL